MIVSSFSFIMQYSVNLLPFYFNHIYSAKEHIVITQNVKTNIFPFENVLFILDYSLAKFL